MGLKKKIHYYLNQTSWINNYLGYHGGRVKAIYVTTCPQHLDSLEGSISNLNFLNISAIFENGIFLWGSKVGLLRNLRFVNINFNIQTRDEIHEGNCWLSTRCQWLMNHNTIGIIMKHSDELDDLLNFKPSTMNKFLCLISILVSTHNERWQWNLEFFIFLKTFFIFWKLKNFLFFIDFFNL